MTTPRDRISYGSHVFPFTGVREREVPLHGLPMLPIRIRGRNGKWSSPVNAVLDTGSNRSLLPADVAKGFGLPALGPPSSIQGAGGMFDAIPTACDVAIADAYFPDVNCFEIQAVGFGVPVLKEPLLFPVVGWDVLRLFELTLSHRHARIELRLET